MSQVSPSLRSGLCLQNNFDPLRFSGGVVAFHTAFALLEKRRIENYEEKGEVNPLAPRKLCIASSVAVESL